MSDVKESALKIQTKPTVIAINAPQRIDHFPCQPPSIEDDPLDLGGISPRDCPHERLRSERHIRAVVKTRESIQIETMGVCQKISIAIPARMYGNNGASSPLMA